MESRKKCVESNSFIVKILEECIILYIEDFKGKTGKSKLNDFVRSKTSTVNFFFFAVSIFSNTDKETTCFTLILCCHKYFLRQFLPIINIF